MAKIALKMGYNPVVVSNISGYEYFAHQHPESKLLIFIEGSMRVTIANESLECLSGDVLVISGNTMHSATIGNEGCKFFWSEKIHTKSNK
ncbi:AraC family ligand binding domain-containing protein [Patescibacteria group bacterium]